MKTLSELGVIVPEILLPKNVDTATWAVVACDQYTQDRTYWQNAANATAGKPSTLSLILPEVYLNDDDKASRIESIRNSMRQYIKDGVFASSQKEFIYIERKTAYGRTRRGLVLAVDLETYEWKPFSKALIRATEATIPSRIPPRMEIRRGAPLESPHIMLLVNDPNHILIEKTGERVKKSAPVYSGSLMLNSGSISGWAVQNQTDIDYVQEALNTLAEQNTSSDGSVFLFAVGDGNHSLATAKAVWDERKESLIKNGASEEELKADSVRYALVELVNIYDEGLTFEPIHRVVFTKESSALVKKLSEVLGGTVTECSSMEELQNAVRSSSSDFGFVFSDGTKTVFSILRTAIKELAVSVFQPALDSLLDSGTLGKDSSIDYIHGESEVLRLGQMQNTVGILLPPVAKDSFFATINTRGPLPRKSFSMGEADEKRFYLECRRLFDI